MKRRGLPCERFTSALAGRRASLGVGADIADALDFVHDVADGGEREMALLSEANSEIISVSVARLNPPSAKCLWAA
jgi:hypothetical protein